jgi:hypothetical protein
MDHGRTSDRRCGVFTVLTVVALLLVTLAIAPAALAVGKPTPTPTPAPSYTPFFGDLHSHSEISDGGGLPADAFAAAKAGGAAFLALTDHSNQISPEEWAALQVTAASFTDATFVAIPSYEITRAWGHMNAYNVPDLTPRKTGNQGGRQDIMAEYYDWLASYPAASSQWNHPTTYSKEFDGFAYRTDARDAVVNLLEIFNYGNYGYYKITDFESSYVKALDLGWHVMPSANSDTHITNWITGYEARTVLLAQSLTPANLYGAMRACRGYATQDKDLRVDYTLNGAVMGSVLAGGSSFTASVTVDDPDPADAPTKLEIVSDGGAVVATNAAPQKGVAWTTTLSSTTSRYYYVRVTTTRNVTGGPGATAWTAPVWTGR